MVRGRSRYGDLNQMREMFVYLWVVIVSGLLVIGTNIFTFWKALVRLLS